MLVFPAGVVLHYCTLSSVLSSVVVIVTIAVSVVPLAVRLILVPMPGNKRYYVVKH